MFLNGLQNTEIMFSKTSKEFFHKPSGPEEFSKGASQ